jgi:hypothetical protein
MQSMCKNFLVITFVCMLNGCIAQKEQGRTGVVTVEFQLYKKLATPTFKQGHRVWFKDNWAIKEVKVTKFKTDTADRQTIEEVVEYYVFANLDSNFFYEYRSFSDTASIRKKYFERDTTQVSAAAELYAKKDITYNGIPEALNDTVIENIVYNRIKFKRQLGKNDIYTIAYFNCDLKNPLFVIYKYDDKNCPIVKAYDYPPDLSAPVMSLEVKHLSDTLTLEEIKIFNAWQKNAEKNPVIR